MGQLALCHLYLWPLSPPLADDIPFLLLAGMNRDITAAYNDKRDERAVILDTPVELDTDIVRTLLAHSDQHLFTIREGMLYKVTAENLNGEAVMTVRDLDQAVSFVQSQGFNARVISRDKRRFENLFARTDEIVKGELLLFSTEYAYRQLGTTVPKDIVLESLILPFVMTLDKNELTHHEGVNRLFHYNGKIWALNPEYIANFGDNVKDSLTKIIDSVRSALKEAALTRQIRIAA